MKRHHILIFCFLLIAGQINAQNSFVQTIKEYYRVNPFEGSFSAFVEALSTDSLLLKKEIVKQTDTSNYLVKGQYKIFNPYSINADRVDMVFHQDIFESKNDAVLKYYTYQLTTYFPDTELARRAVLKDYKTTVKKFQRSLNYTQVRSLKDFGEIENGEIVSLSEEPDDAAPIIVSWQTLGKSKQLAITVILRFVQSNNRAFPVGN